MFDFLAASPIRATLLSLNNWIGTTKSKIPFEKLDYSLIIP